MTAFNGEWEESEWREDADPELYCNCNEAPDDDDLFFTLEVTVSNPEVWDAIICLRDWIDERADETPFLEGVRDAQDMIQCVIDGVSFEEKK